MLIFICFVVLVIIGITCLHLKSYQNKMWFAIIVDCLIVIGMAGMLGTGITAIIIQSTAEAEYQKKLYEEEVLEYRLEESNNLSGNELLYKDIIEFNNDLREEKIYSHSPWINWYRNEKIAEIDYIYITK